MGFRISVTVEPSTMRLAIASHAEDTGQRTVHCTGRIVDAAVEPPQADVPRAGRRRTEPGRVLCPPGSRGLHYGPAFRRVIDAKVGTDVVVATIDPGPPAGEHFTHPVVTDAALQALAALDGLPSATVVPAGIATVRRHDATPRHPVTAVVHRRSGPGIRADITLSGPDGVAFLELLDVEFAPLAPPVSAVTELSKLFYETEWQPLTAQPGWVRRSARGGGSSRRTRRGAAARSRCHRGRADPARPGGGTPCTPWAAPG